MTDINPLTTIYGDGGFNKHTKPDAWGSVVNGYGVDLLQYYTHILTDMNLKEKILPSGKRMVIISNYDDVKIQQNNGAELLASIAALRISLNLINNGIPVLTVFCDSQTVLYWSIRLKIESEVKFSKKKVSDIKELILLRKEFEKRGGKFLKIPGELNLADLGYHKN